MSVLIVYFSKYGQTEKIAWRIAKVAGESIERVKVLDADSAVKLDSIEDYDTVILGSPIYTEKHSRQVAAFIDRFRPQLNTKPTAFYSVSASAAGDEIHRAEATECMNRYLNKCNFQPGNRTIFAGGVPYRQYNFLTRMLMKWICWRAGGDTDTSKNHEYTNWDRVEEFARRFFNRAKSAPQNTSAVA